MGKRKNLVNQVRACTLCPELVKNRTQPVIGEGPVPCSIVFLGEAPGRNEDERGIPFCGITGTILETSARMLGLQRKVDYHILNVLKCRPPENRNPHEAELVNCAPFLRQQLAVIQPKVVMALGKYAQAFFLTIPPRRVRVVRNMGKVLETTGPYVIMSCHPRFTSQGPEVLAAFRIHIRKAIGIAKGEKPICTALSVF
jgi:DNA polymerase